MKMTASNPSTSPWRIFRFAAPQAFFPLAGRLVPWFALLACVLAAAGMWIGFFLAPTDAQQGDVYRIIFIHVPAAWMSMFIYLVIAFWAVIGLSFNTRLSFLLGQALAPTGAMFCRRLRRVPRLPGPRRTAAAAGP